jgi:hypothetical protein
MWGELAIVASIGGALYFYNQKPVDKARSDAWKEGYKSGFLTPGPFTVIGVLGAGYLVFKAGHKG